MATMNLLFHVLSSVASSQSASAASQSSSENPPGVVPINEWSWTGFWESVLNFFRTNVWTILAWFATLFIGNILIYFIVRFSRFVMRKRGIDEMAVRFIAKIIKFLLWLALILILLALMGIPVTGLATGFSAAILAVGMALKDFLSHLAAGIILIVSKNYAKGDFISISGGPEGKIVDINFLFTTLQTYDSTRVTVPNSMMVNHSVTNLEALGTRRIALHFPISHDADLDVVRKTLVDVMKSDGRVKLDPPPLCRLTGIDQNRLDMFLTCYVDVEDYWDVYFYIWDHGFDALKREGIRIPYQKITVYEGHDKDELPVAHDALPERVEKIREDNEIRHLNLIDYDELTPEEVGKILAHNKKVKAKRKAEAAKKKATKGKKSGKKKASESEKKAEEE